MAFVSDFAFNNISRLGDDSCSQDINSIENSQACSYLLQNYFSQDCSMSKARQLAVTQPCINYSGTMGSDICGSNIDDSSRLLIGTIQTHPRCRIDLFQRPFATVPFLGRGSVDPLLESQIQQGDLANNRKSITNLTEVSHIKYSNVPMIPSLQATITNPANLIEGAAAEGWIRGGLPSRDLVKDNDYTNSKSKYQ